MRRLNGKLPAKRQGVNDVLRHRMVVLRGQSSKFLETLVKVAAKLPKQPSAQVSQPEARPTKRARRLTSEEQVAIWTAYQAGATMASLAVVHGITRETVSVVLKRNGVPIRQQRRLDARGLQRAIRLYEQGWSTERVGADLGFDARTIATQLKAAGVRIRGAHERPPGRQTRRPRPES
jgi:DNA-binding CsgD family transcriptional regulator